MSSTRTFAQLGDAEKIVWLFQRKVTEAHRAAVELTCGLTSEAFTLGVARARDLGITGIDPMTGKPAVDAGGQSIGPIYLTQIYERTGWWTARPTRRIVQRAILAGLDRNFGELSRETRLYSMKFGKPIGWAVRAAEANVVASQTLIKALPEMKISEDNDYVITAIDSRPRPQAQFHVSR